MLRDDNFCWSKSLRTFQRTVGRREQRQFTKDDTRGLLKPVSTERGR